MDKLFLFDSQSKKHKEPFGAVVCGENVTLSAYALCNEILSAEIILYSEYDHTEKAIPMEWYERIFDYDRFFCEFTLSETPGIFWYYFRLRTVDNDILYFGKNGIKKLPEEIMSYQLTVSAVDYITPTWFSEGVTYHIFVDRFHRSSKSQRLTEDSYFYVHKDINDTPYYKPNDSGVVENRDIYGGDIEGIIEKLPYLDSLGVKTIYLSPVFEAWSNHKYNTADYKKIDSHFGDEQILSDLCGAASKYGMRVILDGVFSHTGSDSLYFNREGRYGQNTGAWHNVDSPYRSWFDIDENGCYSSWWGIDTLPQVNELDDKYLDFIINDKDSVIGHWMKAGVSGWRLDVADELPDQFISALKKRALKEKNDALVIGEVWEDASTKKAYGVNKKYFTEGVLDGVMNYPLKNAIIDFLTNRISSETMKSNIMSLVENYPKKSQNCLMNIIGTHDTVRVINELSVGSCYNENKDFRAERYLSKCEYETGKTRLFQAAVLQYMFPGSPCIYYGDEIGMQGFEDPFNRRYFTWNNIDDDILCFYKKLGAIKNEHSCMKNGSFLVEYAKGDVIAVSREKVFAFINRGDKTSFFRVPDVLCCRLENGGCKLSGNKLKLLPHSCCVLVKT